MKTTNTKLKSLRAHNEQSIRVKRKVQVDEGPFNERALKSKNVGARALKFVIVHESLEKPNVNPPTRLFKEDEKKSLKKLAREQGA